MSTEEDTMKGPHQSSVLSDAHQPIDASFHGMRYHVWAFTCCGTRSVRIWRCEEPQREPSKNSLGTPSPARTSA